MPGADTAAKAGALYEARRTRTPEGTKEQHQQARLPLATFVRTEWRSALRVMGVVAAPIALVCSDRRRSARS